MRDLFVGPCLVDLLRRDVAFAEQRRQPAERVLRESELRAHAIDLCRGGIGTGGLRYLAVSSSRSAL